MKQEYPQEVYPPYANGPGYIISKEIAKYIISKHVDGDLKVCDQSLILHYCRQWYIALVVKWFLIISSCLKWRMWAWECGLNNSTARHQSSTPIVGSFVSTGAWKIIIQLITNLRGKWYVCGTNWSGVKLAVATSECRCHLRDYKSCCCFWPF